MKPILVNNEAEWQRIAPVLEDKGYYMPEAMEKIPTAWVLPFLPVIIKLSAPFIDWYATNEYEGETQTVDKYLSSQASKPLNWNDATHQLGREKKAFAIAEPYIKPTVDWEAKYKALEQAVKEALNEICVKGQVATDAKQVVIGEKWHKLDGLETGYIKSFKILKEKTGL